MTAAVPLPLTVFTGFLGSGKTTTIRHLLADAAFAGTAVIVNEFGEIGLDHALIESAEEDLVELSTGCLCCAMRGDLHAAVARLAARRDGGAHIERIVLETTGLADPAPILQTLIADPLLRDAVALQQVAVTVDAVTGGATLDAHEVSRKQAALADILLLTKTDLAQADATLVERLTALNPQARLHIIEHGALAPSTLLDAAPTARETTLDTDEGAHRHDHPHDDITSVSLRRAEPVPAVALTLFLQALAEVCGGELLRVKGLVAIAESPDTPAVVHGVQHVFHPVDWLPAWPGSDRDTRLVFIGHRLEAAWIAALLDTVIDDVGAAADALAR